LIIAWYIVAKIAEHYDDAIFDALGFWSGHTIKHLVGAISLIYVLKLIVAWKKELISAAAGNMETEMSANKGVA
jgi:hypothetical protein